MRWRRWSRSSRTRPSCRSWSGASATARSKPAAPRLMDAVMKDAELAQELHLRDPAEPAADRLLTRINAPLARACMVACVAGLLVIVAIVFWQVFGRYVLNS